MHDPSDGTQDEENQTTTLTSNDGKDAVNESDDEGQSDHHCEDMDTEDYYTTERSAAAAESHAKRHAADHDNNADNSFFDEEMADDATDDNPQRGSNDNGISIKHEQKNIDKNNLSTLCSLKNSNDTTTSTDAKSGNGNATNGSNTVGVSSSAPVSIAPPPPPVLKGTLSFNVELRRHMIRGMWNYENSSTFPPQRFELLRNLDKDEDPTVLPSDGEFYGSFSLAYFHTTSKGKQKERSKVIPESGVKITFTPINGSDGEFDVDGEGTNQFGVFNINGKATPSEHEGDPTFDIVLRKRYKPSHLPTPVATLAPGDKKKKKKVNAILGSSADLEVTVEPDAGPLPPPSESFPSRVVCLRGKLVRDQSDDLGVSEGIYRINGMWSSGLDLILADPQNVRGLCNRFEYEHKSSQPNNSFPVSGRYSGWFDLTGEDGSKTRINEKDITLKFRRNNAGYHNVEGKGSNAFGKYTISGTLTQDHVITIFRHFQAPKKKLKDPPAKPDGVTLSVSPSTAGAPKEIVPPPDMKLTLDNVEIPGDDQDGDPAPSIPPPPNGTYSAISRGVMRRNEDGSHTCAGKWAMTREHFTNGAVSDFSFRLEPHFAAQGAVDPTNVTLSGAPTESLTFPVDSSLYKGSFKMKRGATKYTSVIDQQIALKFRRNSEGSFNVHGKGTNSIGMFSLIGKLILIGSSSGHVELYRMYPLPSPVPEQVATVPVPSKAPIPALPPPPSPPPSKPSVEKVSPVASTSLPSVSAPSRGLLRRESSRLVKIPSRLEDDDPAARMGKLLEKCNQLLKLIREKDVENGAFFGNPVDPVALNITDYYQIISEPMDLGTIQSKLDSDEIDSPEEFGRLVRLVFENAMTFNVDPTHVVHQASRQLLILFNQKFRDIERASENIRRQHKLPETAAKTDAVGGKQISKSKKRKGASEELISPKRRRLLEAQTMASDNASNLSALIAAAPTGVSPDGNVSRAEFSLMIQMIQKVQEQVVQTFRLLAEMSSDTIEEPPATGPLSPPTPAEAHQGYIPPPQDESLPAVADKKKTPKRKEPTYSDDEKPLTLEEQQAMTVAIYSLPRDKLPEIVKIIRECANLDDDEEQIDMEIDQLDTATQRKLQRYVMKNVKPPRKKAKTIPKKKPVVKKPEAVPVPTVPKKPQTTPASKPADHGSFFAFDSKLDDSDSDTEDGEIPQSQTSASAPNKDDDFNLGDAHDDDDDLDDVGNNDFKGTWSMASSEPVAATTAKDVDDDDWGLAREQAEVSRARDAERKAREEKMRAEAELAKNQRLADAAARGEEVRAQREEVAANEARQRERKEKEALEKKKAARDAERAKLLAVKQEVDLEEQRDVMRQFESNYMGDEADGASPSSDFGF